MDELVSNPYENTIPTHMESLTNDQIQAHIMDETIAEGNADQDTNVVVEKSTEEVYEREEERNVLEYPINWYIDTDQLEYLEECKRFKTIPSGFFLRHMMDEALVMRHSLLGAQRMKPIFSSLSSNPTVTILDLTDASLRDEAIPDLCNLFKENNFILDLNLSENRFTSRHAESLCDVLASSAQMERINLSNNFFDDNSSPYFAELMATALRMTYLNLSHNEFAGQATLHFGRALPQATSLLELDLSWNRLGTATKMRPFGKGLAENKNIKSLNLAFNGIGPKKGCPDLALALKGNKVLQVLDLSGNRINPEGAVFLGRGFVNNSTLKYLYMSRNPLQTGGCFALLTGIMRNSNCGLRELDLQGTPVNNDFRDLQDEQRKKLPNLIVRCGKSTTEQTRALSPKYDKSLEGYGPKELIQAIGRITKISLGAMLSAFDPTGEKLVTRQQFIHTLNIYLPKVGIALTEEQMKQLLIDVDVNNDEEINFRDFEI